MDVVAVKPEGGGAFRSAPGVVLLVLLTLVLAAAAIRPRDPGQLSPREVSFLLASHSLAYDLDLRFAAEDEQRARNLDLSRDALSVRQSAAGAVRFDVPVVYPLITAPWVRMAPLRGPVILNALLFGLAALVVAHRLERQLGRQAPAVISVCLFASVVYRNVFLLQPTGLLVALVALVLSLAFRHEEPARHGLEEVYRPAESPAGGVAVSLTVGLLIGLATSHHALYALLVLPIGLAIPARRRRRDLCVMVAGLGLVLLIVGLMRGGVRLDLQAVNLGVLDAWNDFSVGATIWNLLYLAVGRNTGLLPYALPLMLLFGLWRGGSGRSLLALTAIAGILGPVLLDPFNYYGGLAAVGNGWAVPWLVALLFLPTRPLPRGWLAGTILLAIPAMYPAWLAPGIEPVTANGTYRHASGWLHAWLPVETTQERLPPSGQASGQRLWIRSLSREAVVSGSNRWRLAGDGKAELQIATPTPLEAVYLQYGSEAEPELEVRGGELGDTVLLPDGGIGFRIEDLKRKALHPMWWSAERHHNYVLQLSMPEARSRSQTVVVTAIAEDVVRAQP